MSLSTKDKKESTPKITTKTKKPAKEVVKKSAPRKVSTAAPAKRVERSPGQFLPGDKVSYLGKDGKPCDEGVIQRDLGPHLEVLLEGDKDPRHLLRERIVLKA